MGTIPNSSRARSWYFSHFLFSLISRFPDVATFMTWYFSPCSELSYPRLCLKVVLKLNVEIIMHRRVVKPMFIQSVRARNAKKMLHVPTYPNDIEKVVLLSRSLQFFISLFASLPNEPRCTHISLGHCELIAATECVFSTC